MVVGQTLDGELRAEQIVPKFLEAILDREAFFLSHVVITLRGVHARKSGSSWLDP